jgi:hypothetical protein
MGKVEPFESIILKSEITGIVSTINDTNKFVKDRNIVVLNTDMINIEIKSLKKELKNQQKILKIYQKRFDSKNKISSISLYEKNQEELAFLNAQKKYLNIKKQLNIKLEQKKKYIFHISNKYISEIYVQKGDFVSIGYEIATINDISKSKIILYIQKDDIKGIKNKNIYIDNKKSNFTIKSISIIPDKKYISSYKVELIKPNIKPNTIFGQVVKVNFRQ